MIQELLGQIKGRASDGSGDFCQRIVGLVCVGIFHGARLGAWYLGHGAIAGDGVARAAVMLHIECGKHASADIVVKAQAVLSEAELLQAIFDVGYFPPNTPPDD